MYEAGTVVAGKYRIDRPLGTGGMGIVVAATHLQLGTPVALKFLHHDLTQNQSVVDRFMREARWSAQLRGENVCRVSDVGTTETGQPFIVMELLAGQDLGTVIRDSGALQVSVAAEIIMQACIALGEAHALGFVHRDIKPGNLFWTQRPDGSALIKVLDFGVAKAPEELNFSLTQTQNVIGSPGYMSPEQLKSSKTVDVRSDIWSLGIVLYELVSARKPFHGESITELALRVAMDPTPPLAGGVPASFESVILRCLEKQPQRRFKDVADLANALGPFVGPTRGAELAYAVSRVLGGGNQLVRTAPQPQSAPTTPTTLRGASGVVPGSAITSKRSWRLPVVAAAGAAAGIAIALGMVIGAKTDRRTSASAPTETHTTKMQVAPATPAVEPPAAPEAAAATAVAPAATATTPAKAIDAPASAAPTVESKPATKLATPKPAAVKPSEHKPDARSARPKPAEPKQVTAKVETKKPKPAERRPAPKPAKPKPTKPVGDVGDSRL